MHPLERKVKQLEQVVRELQSANTKSEERFRNLFRTATVTDFDPTSDRVVARDLAEGDDDNGTPDTPPIRVLGQAGGAAGVNKRSTLSPGEQVLIISMGGELNATSIAVPLGYNAENPSPSDHEAEELVSIGGSTLRLHAGDASLLSSRVDLGSTGGKAVARKGDRVMVSVGSSAGLWEIIEGATNTFAT